MFLTRIIVDYIRLRYRLLPVIYAAVREAYDYGTPLLRRCDLYWSEFTESVDPTQCLFGDDLLIAPIIEPITKSHSIPAGVMSTHENQPGLKAEYFDNENLEGAPKLTRVDSTIGFDIFMKAPAEGIPAEHFSVRWTGMLVRLTETGLYTFNVLSDDGVRVFVDGTPIIDYWHPSDSEMHTGRVYLETGKSYGLRVEYFNRTRNARLLLGWSKPSDTEEVAKRCTWLPPGEWQNLWTGARLAGPMSIEVLASLEQVPLFVRCPGIILSVPQMMQSGERPWNTIIIDAFVPTCHGSRTRTLYEDDGISDAYLDGASRKTSITLARSRDRIMLDIGAAAGSFSSSPTKRTWVARLHLPPDAQMVEARVDLNPIPIQSCKLIDPQVIGSVAQLLAGAGTAGAGKVIELTLDRDISSGVTLAVLLQ